MHSRTGNAAAAAARAAPPLCGHSSKVVNHGRQILGRAGVVFGREFFGVWDLYSLCDRDSIVR